MEKPDGQKSAGDDPKRRKQSSYCQPVKKAQMQMHIPPEDIHIGATVGVLLPDIGPEVFPAEVEYIHPDGYFVTVRRRPERRTWGDPFAHSNGYLTSVRPEQVVEAAKI